MKRGTLRYNAENDRYGLLSSGLWVIDGFLCGERLEVHVEGKWIPTRMEYDHRNREWYLVGTELRGEALAYLTARVEW